MFALDRPACPHDEPRRTTTLCPNAAPKEGGWINPGRGSRTSELINCHGLLDVFARLVVNPGVQDKQIRACQWLLANGPTWKTSLRGRPG